MRPGIRDIVDKYKKNPKGSINFSYKNLTSTELSEIIPHLEGFEQLKVINLQDNKITSIPNNLWKLKNLTEVNLRYNQISKIE